jgi:hypothetical protein
MKPMKTTKFADYELIEQLAPGNHGTFYKARPPARLGLDASEVAVKILDRHATNNEFKRMAAELRVLLELGHPRLAEVLDAGHEGGRLYYTTRFYHEGPLRVGPCAEGDVAVIAAVVADAAEAAHALHEIGVAHRDIKPSNILLAAGRGHLSDLGVANYANADFTTTGASPVGTLAYADPRLIHGDPAGRASDVWSLGATLHAAVTGSQLLGQIPNTHLVAAIEHVLRAEVTVAPHCPAAIAAVVARATRPDRTERYATAAELAEELRAVADLARSYSGLARTPARPAGTGTAEPDAEHRPLPTGGDDPGTNASLPAYRQPVYVAGQRSVAGHLNHPEATRCWVSGEERGSLGPWTPERGPRPPLGMLVFDDGRSYVLTWDTVVGRQPDADDRVATGAAAPLAFEGEMTMSRAHVLIELRDWHVYITDLSSNGTELQASNTGTAETLTRGEPVAIADGDQLVLGGPTLTYRGYHPVLH